LSLRAKERRFGADSGQKYEDLVQKYQAQPVPPTYQRQQATREIGTARASNGMVVRDQQTSFCCFCFSDMLHV